MVAVTRHELAMVTLAVFFFYYGAESCGRRALALGRGGTDDLAQCTDGLDGFFAARARFHARASVRPGALQHARSLAPQGWEQPRQLGGVFVGLQLFQRIQGWQQAAF